MTKNKDRLKVLGELIMNLKLKPEIETALKKLTLLIDTQNFLLFERKL